MGKNKNKGGKGKPAPASAPLAPTAVDEDEPRIVELPDDYDENNTGAAKEKEKMGESPTGAGAKKEEEAVKTVEDVKKPDEQSAPGKTIKSKGKGKSSTPATTPVVNKAEPEPVRKEDIKEASKVNVERSKDVKNDGAKENNTKVEEKQLEDKKAEVKEEAVNEKVTEVTKEPTSNKGNAFSFCLFINNYFASTVRRRQM